MYISFWYYLAALLHGDMTLLVYRVMAKHSTAFFVHTGEKK